MVGVFTFSIIIPKDNAWSSRAYLPNPNVSFQVENVMVFVEEIKSKGYKVREEPLISDAASVLSFRTHTVTGWI